MAPVQLVLTEEQQGQPHGVQAGAGCIAEGSSLKAGATQAAEPWEGVFYRDRSAWPRNDSAWLEFIEKETCTALPQLRVVVRETRAGGNAAGDARCVCRGKCETQGWARLG